MSASSFLEGELKVKLPGSDGLLGIRYLLQNVSDLIKLMFRLAPVQPR